MTSKWYVVQCDILTKEEFLNEMKRAGYKEKTQGIVDVLTYEFKQDIINVESDKTLLDGYVILSIEDEALREVVKIIKTKRIGTFFNLNKEGIPYPLPDEQVAKFKKKVQSNKDNIKIGARVKVLEGILSGFEGKVLRKKDLMVEVSVELPNRVIKRWVPLPHISKKLRD